MRNALQQVHGNGNEAASIVDRLLAMPSDDAVNDELDRAVHRRAEIALSRMIQSTLDRPQEKGRDAA